MANYEIRTIVPVADLEQEERFAAVVSGCQKGTLPVVTKEEYDLTAELIKKLKGEIDAVVAYYAGAKERAHRLHKEICDAEAYYTKPIKAYIEALKAEMKKFLAEEERKRRKAEEELREAARKEAEALMMQAAKIESAGGDASNLVAEAIMTETVGNTITISGSNNKTDGVVRKKDWEIVEINEAEVPTEIAGVVIRPVDTSAIMKLVRATKGTVKIPGIKIEEKETIVVRR